MVCENIRHYSKFMNSYLSCTSSLEDQIGHLQQSCLIYPNATTFRKSVMETADAAVAPTQNEFSFHIPSGFMQSGQMVDLRSDAFGGIQLEFLLQPDSNVLFNTDGSTTGIGDAHYELSNLKLTCEISDIPAGTPSGSAGAYDFNTITSLYTSINSTNAQIQYSLALQNVISAFVTFMPVSNINTLTQDGQATTFPSGDGSSLTALAPIRRVQWLKGGSKYPAEFDYVTNIVNATNTGSKVVDPQIVKTLVQAISPDSQYSMERLSVSPVNMNRNYNMTTSATGEDSYMNIAEGGGVYGLAVKYGIGETGEDFTSEQWGLSVESDLKSDNPVGVYIFIKSKSQLLYSPQGVQLRQ
jgi:hypothetical protein